MDTGAAIDRYLSSPALAESTRRAYASDLRELHGWLERRGTGRDEVFYYRGTQLMAARVGPWKAHFRTQPAFGGEPTLHEPPLLYQLDLDPGEQQELSAAHPDVLARIAAAVARHRDGLVPAPSQLELEEPDA